jgi:MFS family permease
MVLCVPTDIVLLVLISIYMILAILLGLLGGWRYQRSVPKEETGREYHMQSERVVLTLAGFSLTSLSLFVSIQFRELAQLSSTILFFSIALSVLVLSYISLLMRFRQFFLYLSNILVNTGLLSIASGFLVFFESFLSWSNGSTIVFSVLVILVFIGILVDQFFYYQHIKNWEKVKEDEREKKG